MDGCIYYGRDDRNQIWRHDGEKRLDVHDDRDGMRAHHTANAFAKAFPDSNRKK